MWRSGCSGVISKKFNQPSMLSEDADGQSKYDTGQLDNEAG